MSYKNFALFRCHLAIADFQQNVSPLLFVCRTLYAETASLLFALNTCM
jgi:hypothetical protein